jgi:hypothetical protein
MLVCPGGIAEPHGSWCVSDRSNDGLTLAAGEGTVDVDRELCQGPAVAAQCGIGGLKAG